MALFFKMENVNGVFGIKESGMVLMDENTLEVSGYVLLVTFNNYFIIMDSISAIGSILIYYSVML